jgi:hypothetical protein
MSRRTRCLVALVTALVCLALLTSRPHDNAAAQPPRAAASAPPVIRAVWDFSGDSKPDLAVWRPSTGEWWIRGMPKVQWGRAGDIPVPAHYFESTDADVADFAVWRPSTGEWWIKGQNGQVQVIRWGVAGDIPIPGQYDCGGVSLSVPAVWRPSTGVWHVKAERTVCMTQWGRTGDVPNLGLYIDTDVTAACGAMGLSVWRPSTATFLTYAGGLHGGFRSVRPATSRCHRSSLNRSTHVVRSRLLCGVPRTAPGISAAGRPGSLPPSV